MLSNGRIEIILKTEMRNENHIKQKNRYSIKNRNEERKCYQTEESKTILKTKTKNENAIRWKNRNNIKNRYEKREECYKPSPYFS